MPRASFILSSYLRLPHTSPPSIHPSVGLGTLGLPFGLKSSQDIFQRKIDECYEGLEGVAALVDDVLVYGQT
jgi:hypothetical protein